MATHSSILAWKILENAKDKGAWQSIVHWVTKSQRQLHAHVQTHTHAKSLQLCQTLCDPMDYSPPGSSVHGILKAGILEWVAIPPPGDLPNPGIERMSHLCLLHWQMGSLPLMPPGKSYTHS